MLGSTRTAKNEYETPQLAPCRRKDPDDDSFWLAIAIEVSGQRETQPGILQPRTGLN
jgi:hypothetical protein